MIEKKKITRNIWYGTDKAIDIKPTYLESGELYCIELFVREEKELKIQNKKV